MQLIVLLLSELFSSRSTSSPLANIAHKVAREFAFFSLFESLPFATVQRFEVGLPSRGLRDRQQRVYDLRPIPSLDLVAVIALPHDTRGKHPVLCSRVWSDVVGGVMPDHGR